jgi:hypothetical protein
LLVSCDLAESILEQVHRLWPGQNQVAGVWHRVDGFELKCQRALQVVLFSALSVFKHHYRRRFLSLQEHVRSLVLRDRLRRETQRVRSENLGKNFRGGGGRGVVHTINQEFEFADLGFIDFNKCYLKKAFGVRTSQLFYKGITNFARDLLGERQVI